MVSCGGAASRRRRAARRTRLGLTPPTQALSVNPASSPAPVPSTAHSSDLSCTQPVVVVAHARPLTVKILEFG